MKVLGGGLGLGLGQHLAGKERVCVCVGGGMRSEVRIRVERASEGCAQQWG